MTKFLGQNISSLTSQQQSILTDGSFTCSWRDVLDILEDLSRFFSQQKIEITDCLALECDNSLPSALSLLFLLEKGYSFFLLPQGTPISTIPPFCRYHLTPNSEKIDRLDQFDRWLKITENQNCQPINDKGQKLYIRTSGSTGTPKITVHSQVKLLENILNCVQRLTLNCDDRIAIPVPIYHLYGLGAAFLPSVAIGASIDLQKGANLLRYMQREREFDPNIVFMTPSFCETLIKGRKSARGYKLTVVAGDRLKEDVFNKYEQNHGCLVQLYGSTEMGAIASGSPTDDKEIRSQTVGLPMSGVKLRLKNPSSEVEMQEGGEIWCQHSSGFEGYVDAVGQPITSTAYDHWLAIKDLGKLRSNGYLEVWGRSDRSVNRDGLLVLFADIEKEIEKLVGIDTVVVESYGESQRGKGLIAFCVLTKGSDLTEKEIRTLCFDKLPKRAIPDRAFVLKKFPLLPNGKIDRQQLISLFSKDLKDL